MYTTITIYTCKCTQCVVYYTRKLQNITKYYKTWRNTFQKWKEMGFKVKKGEHAVTCTKLWKPKAKKYTDTNGEEKVENNFFLARAYLFKLNQVERIAPTN